MRKNIRFKIRSFAFILLGLYEKPRSKTQQFTLKTNISRRKKATVLKLPSQMLGLPLPEDGRSPEGGRAGRDCRSCFLSEVECVRRAGSVGRGRVGSSMAVGIPAKTRLCCFHLLSDLFLYQQFNTFLDTNGN